MAGRLADDRRTKFADYLDRRLRWWESEDDIKPSTLASYREAIELYFKPGLGHLRLAGLRDHHFRDLAAASGLLDVAFDSMPLPAREDRDLTMTCYTAEPGSPSDDALKVLASWAATASPSEDTIPGEHAR